MAGDVRYKVVKQIDTFDGSTLMIGGDRDAAHRVGRKCQALALWGNG